MASEKSIFSLSSEDKDSRNRQYAGLYDSNGNIRMSWDELIKEKYINITSDGVLASAHGHEFSESEKLFDDCTLIIPQESMYLADGLPASPVEITVISDSAFLSLPIKNVIIPNSISEIGDGTFYECDKLEHVYTDYQKSGLTRIGKMAFGDTPSLNETIHPKSLISIGESAYEHSGIKHADISGLRVGDYAFKDCYQLETIHINNENVEYKDPVPANTFIGADHVKYYYGKVDAYEDLSFTLPLPANSEFRASYLETNKDKDQIDKNYKGLFWPVDPEEYANNPKKAIPDYVKDGVENPSLISAVPYHFMNGKLVKIDDLSMEEITHQEPLPAEKAQDNYKQNSEMNEKQSEDKIENTAQVFFEKHSVFNVGLYPKDQSPSQEYIKLASAKAEKSKYDDIYKENALYMKPSKQNIKDGTYHIDVPVGYAGEVFGKNRQNLEELKDKISLLYPEVQKVVIHKKAIAEFDSKFQEAKRESKVAKETVKNHEISNAANISQIDDGLLEYYEQSALAELDGMAEETYSTIDELAAKTDLPESVINDVRDNVDNIIKTTNNIVNDSNIGHEEKIAAISNTQGILAVIRERISIIVEEININKEALLNKVRDFSTNISIHSSEKDIARLKIDEKAMEMQKAKLEARHFVFNKPKKIAEIDYQISQCRAAQKNTNDLITELKGEIEDRRQNLTDRRVSLDKRIAELNKDKEIPKKQRSMNHEMER